MAYILWELAKNPEVQTKLRAELDANVSAKGKIEFSAVELENMPYLNAVIKVSRPVYAKYERVN
jgi:cytochrome P450